MRRAWRSPTGRAPVREALAPGWVGGRHGHYQSQLKALMAMLRQPGGTVRPPRLPVTDPAALAAMRQILAEEGLLSVEATA